MTCKDFRIFLCLIWILNVFGRLKSLECPGKCKCERLSVGINADCSQSDFTNIPENIPQRATYLNLSFNEIQVINVRFTLSVKILDLSHNKLSTLDNDFAQTFSKLEVLNLSNNFFTAVPRNLPQTLKSLRLSFNRLKTVDFSSFLGLSYIQSFYFDHNFIETIFCSDVRQGKDVILKSLEVVTFHENKIKNLPQNFHECLGYVRKVSLSNNSLANISSNVFSNLKFLRVLDLSRNVIENIPSNSFYENLKILLLSNNILNSLPIGLPMLELFDISYNNISKIPEVQNSDIYPQEVFLIGGNPFQCDCDLLWLKEFYHTRSYLKDLVNVDVRKFVPYCEKPLHLNLKTWDSIGDVEFGCEIETSEKGDNRIDKDDERYSWQLKDLHIVIKKIGDIYIEIEWKSTRGLSDVLLISSHPFGKRNLKKKSVAHPHLGKFVIKNLTEKTPYIVCVSVISEEIILSNDDIAASTDDCHEVVTMETIQDTNFLQLSSFCVSLFLASGVFCFVHFKIWNHVFIFLYKFVSNNQDKPKDNLTLAEKNK